MAFEAAVEMTEVFLRELVRALLRDCCIPREAPAQMWGGEGSGWLCDVCGQPIAHGEAEYELLFAGPVDSSLHLHPSCYQAWEIERRRPWQDDCACMGPQ
jgi:hypothetical protein